MGTSSELRLGFLEIIAFSITSRCPLKCRHCMVAQNDIIPKDMAVEDLLRFLQEVSETHRIRFVTITGGEPFIVFDTLKEAIIYADSLGLITNVVTSAYWAHNHQVAYEILKQLPKLQYIAISTDEFHQEYVPLHYVRNAVVASKETGKRIALGISVCRFEDPSVKETLDSLRDVLAGVQVMVHQISPLGRAAHQIPSYRFPFSSGFPNIACKNIGYLNVMPDGTVHSCCGPIAWVHQDNPLKLGCLNQVPLRTIMQRVERDPLIHSLRVWGPGKLANWIQKKGKDGGFRSQYILNDPCLLCYDLLINRTHVRELKEIMVTESFRKQLLLSRAYLFGEL